MSSLKAVFCVGSLIAVWAFCQAPSGSGNVAAQQTLSIREEPGRIVLGWSGPVQEPMSERVTAALDRFKSDPRRLVLVLNSPGGSVEHGRKVAAAIRARHRAIDTFVEKAGVCASMCVPIFLAGTRRMADPEAYFMFHQASLSRKSKDDLKRPELGETERALLSRTASTIESRVTDDLYRNDMGIRGVSAVWLTRMRQTISGREVWLSGQQLVDEGSGIVDTLTHTPA